MSEYQRSLDHQRGRDRVPLDATLDVSDMPLHGVCCERIVENHGPVIIVGADIENVAGARQCPPRHCLQAAELLVDTALRLEPGLASRHATAEPVLSLITRLLADAGSHLRELLRRDDAVFLRSVIDQEVERRCDEQLALSREAARQRGLRDAKDAIAKLVSLIGEQDTDLRNLGLSALLPELSRAYGDLGTVAR